MIPRNRLSTVMLLVAVVGGCGWNHGHKFHGRAPGMAMIQNPLYVPLSDREFMWNQLVDTIDDYFRIDYEERVRLEAGILTEGRIETLPEIGSTVLEPWRKDSTHGYEKAYASLQSMRRRAVVRVRPQADGGYLVDVAVFKELEDVSRPEYSTVDLEGLRHDGTIQRSHSRFEADAVTIGWIPLGRDTQLEQVILSKLRGRLGIVGENY